MDNHSFTMKKNHLLLCLPALVLAGVLAIFNYGCGKKPAVCRAKSAAINPLPSSRWKRPASPRSRRSSIPAAISTCISAPRNGSTAFPPRSAAWRQTFTAMPDLKPEDTANVNKAFDIVTRLIKDSGIEDVSGVGMSSVEIEKGMFRNKALLHHYPGKGDGFLWQLAGKEPHPLTGLDFLPADTALAVFSDADLPLLWTVAQKEVAKADLPQAQQWLDKLPAQFEQPNPGQMGRLSQLARRRIRPRRHARPIQQHSHAAARRGALQIPTPGLLLVVKVNDDTIFNRIDQATESQPAGHQRGQARPQDADDARAPAVHRRTPPQRRQQRRLPVHRHDRCADSRRARREKRQEPRPQIHRRIQASRAGSARPGQPVLLREPAVRRDHDASAAAGHAANSAKAEPQMAQWMQSLYHSRPAFAYSVGVNTPEGCLTVGNGSQSYANTVLLPAVAVPGMLSAIAIPNFVKARATSQQNACINNLRQIDAAKQQWALGKRQEGHRRADQGGSAALSPQMAGLPGRRHLHHRRRQRTTDVQHPRPRVALKSGLNRQHEWSANSGSARW